MWRQKLTKAFFLGLPDGVYLLSNVFVKRCRPVYEGRVLPKAQRAEQWKLLPRGIRQRTCNVFRSKANSNAWLLASLQSAQGAVPTGRFDYQHN